MAHTITHFDNGGSGWVEFECEKCGVDMDFFDFDMIDMLDAAENNFDMRCRNCKHVAPVHKTEDQG